MADLHAPSLRFNKMRKILAERFLIKSVLEEEKSKVSGARKSRLTMDDGGYITGKSAKADSTFYVVQTNN